VALLVNDGTADVMFGVYAKVDRWNGDAWVPAGQLVMCMDHWHCTAQILAPGGSVEVPSIGLSPQPRVPGPVERFTTDGLQPGWYRISQVANEGITAAAVLEIADDAPAPAPLVPVDRPAISVSPALLSPTGGKVMLYPLIPAGAGAQSRQDVEEAIQGLSETARIERWDGSSWTAVQNVDLEKTGNDDLVRSTELPPLPPGVYRARSRGARDATRWQLLGFEPDRRQRLRIRPQSSEGRTGRTASPSVASHRKRDPIAAKRLFPPETTLAEQREHGLGYGWSEIELKTSPEVT
jgi:hypothetical protein